MKHTLLFVLAIICPAFASLASAGSLAAPIAKRIHTLSNAIACEARAGTPGLSNTPQCRNRNNPARTDAREFDKAADHKTLRECIKPDNLIDDDVRKCMKGL